jgi:DNA-binding beta-propeller fold protein YncE
MKRRFFVALTVSCSALLALASFASAQERLYGADGAGGNPATNLYLINPANGAVLQTLGPVGFGVTGLAVDPATGTLYGVTGGADDNNPGFLITVNKTNGAGTVVGDLFASSTSPVADITFTPDGTLYGWSENTDDLVTINKATGAATVVGDSGTSTSGSGLASNAAGVLYFAGSGDDGPLRTVDRTTGALTAVATMDGTLDRQLAALAFDAAGTLFGARLDDAGGSNPRPADMVTIDPTTGAVTSRGPAIDRFDAIAFETVEPAKKPNCKKLRKKLKRQKKGLAKARTETKRAMIKENIADTRRRLKKRGC